MMANQTRVTRIGWVEASDDPGNGFGLPQSIRSEEVRVLIGFHSANGWSQVGRLASGTNAFETKVIGKITMNDTCCATSTVGTDVPSQTPIHDMQKANSSSSTIPNRNCGSEVWT